MLTRISLFLLLGGTLLSSSIYQSTTPSALDYDLLIQNGRIVDGSGRPGYSADVAVKGDCP